MKVAIVDVQNGEGYSEPTIQIAEKSSLKSLEIIAEMMETYGQDDWNKTMVSDESDSVVCSIEGKGHSEGDGGAIHIIDIPTYLVSIIHVEPDICSASLTSSHDTVEEAVAELTRIVNGDLKLIFEEDDVEEYDGELNFGSHHDDGFSYFEIVSAL